MRKFRAATGLLCLILVVLLNGATELYVSPDARAGGDGSIGNPFRTIQEARDKVRTMTSGMSEDIVVYLRGNANGGYHFVEETIRFDQHDGGTGGHSVIYRNYEGETPVISGGIVVTGWEQVPGTSPVQWKAQLDHDEKVRYLFVDFVPGYRARGPKIPRHEDYGSFVDGQPLGFESDQIALSNAADVELYKRSSWCDHQFCVERLEGNSTFIMQQPYWMIGSDLNGGWRQANTRRFRIENAKEYLDSPGEFAFDRPDKMLYYIPRTDQDMNSATAIVNSTDVLFEIKGESPSNRVKNLQFRGIAFHNADYPLTRVLDSYGYTTSQGSYAMAHYVKDGEPAMDYWRGNLHMLSAVRIFHAERILVEGCRFEYLGGGGIDAYNDVHDCSINGNTFRWVAGSAVYVGDFEHGSLDNTYPQELYPCPPENRYWVPCKNIVVSNNLVRKCGWDFTHAPLFMVGFTEACSFIHNDAGPCGFNSISIGWGWNHMDPSGTARKNRIGCNRFNAACQHRGDCGHVYSLGYQDSTVVDSNYCYTSGKTIIGNRESDDWDPVREHDAGDLIGWGAFYPDQGSKGHLYVDNVYDGSTAIYGGGWWGGDGNTYDGVYYSKDAESGACPGATNKESFDPSSPPDHIEAIIDNAGLQDQWQSLTANVDWTPGEPAPPLALNDRPPAPITAGASGSARLSFSGAGYPVVNIRLTTPSRVMVELVDTRGRVAASHERRSMAPGAHRIRPAEYGVTGSAPRGVYALRVTAGSEVKATPVVICR